MLKMKKIQFAQSPAHNFKQVNPDLKHMEALGEGVDAEMDSLLNTLGEMGISGRNTVEGTPVPRSRSSSSVEDKAAPSALHDQFLHVLSPTSQGSGLPTGKNGVMVFQCSSASSNAHDTGDHQETMLRTELLCGVDGCLRRDALQDSVVFINPDLVRGAEMSDLLRVHDHDYLAHLQRKCLMSGGRYDCSRGVTLQPNFYAPAGKLDCDTPLTPMSLEASRLFCGAAILAVDTVLADWAPDQPAEKDANTLSRRAFVVGRPPGHHAGPSGCVVSEHFWRRPDMASSGFCLLNTVAVSAAYALYNYGRESSRTASMRSVYTGSTVSSGRPPRVAIVDIDVHHGNGTEDIVRNVVAREQFLPLPSSWAPMSRTTHKPWLSADDSDNIFFGSINLHAADRFYPCSGGDGDSGVSVRADKRGEEERCPRIINVALTPVGPGPWDIKARLKLTPNQRSVLCKQAGEELRQKVSDQLLPALMEFSPDVLFISSGFDSHYNDMYHFLTEGDFHWLTEALCETTRDGRVVSVLEGGYSLESPVPAPPKPPVPKKHVTRNAQASPKKASPAPPTPPERMEMAATRFAVEAGDGGLVKGVLGHVAALAGRKEWIAGRDELMV